jgi:predicted secreted protein
MAIDKEDCRSKKIVFVSSCLLNTNNKVLALARYGGFSLEFVELLHKYDLGMQQMDCPETLYLGIQRWWCTKNLYDNVGFRKHCREIARRNVDYMVCYEQMGYQTVAVLSCNGSPTCGVDLTSFSEEWGGPPQALDYGEALVEGAGVFIEELRKEIHERGVKMPPFYGLNLDEPSKPFEQILAEFEEYIKGLLE